MVHPSSIPSMTPCAQHIASVIAERGRISFAEFMRLALYHPDHGYYSKPTGPIGREGDYYTSPEVHQVFGEMIADLIGRMASLVQGEREFTIVELGAGKGTLCQDILCRMRERDSRLFKRIRYAVDEQNPHRRESIARLVAGLGMSGMLRFVHLGSLRTRPDGGIEGCVLSNEFFDSLPTHRVVVREGTLREIHVTFDGGYFRDELGELSTPALSHHFQRLRVELPEGYTTEVNLEAVDTMERVGRVLRKGFAVTIDYGYEARELYGAGHPRGTLMCYHRHRAHEDPYMNVGEQDITAHVDFTSLVGAGETAGLLPLCLTTQAKFLLASGLLKRMAEEGPHLSPTQQIRRRLAMKPLIMPGGMGDMFKVLVQRKDVELADPHALFPFAAELGSSFPRTPPRGW